MKLITLCPDCICALQSHGDKLYVGDYTENECKFCGETESVSEVMLE